MEAPTIYMIYGKDAAAMTRSLLDAYGIDERIKDKERIILKPNLVTPSRPEEGATTHTQIIIALIEYLQELGKEDITIAEGSWVGASTEEAFRRCGYHRIAAEYGVKLLDTKKDSFRTLEYDGMRMEVSETILGCDYLINLDWETLGSLCNSCAGGDYFNFYRDCGWESTPKRSVAIELSLSGFLGGHSGVGIHLGHANALVSAATALEYLRQNGVEFRVASFSGGQAKNAIPASANAVITLTVAEAQKAMDQLEAFKAEFYGGYRDVEPSGVFTFSLGSAPERVMGEAAGYSLVGLMSSVPNDVFTMSPFIPGLVESSANLGVISLDGRVSFTVFARSSSAYRAMQTGIICRSLASAYGFELDSDGHVPGWAVNPNSVLTKIACEQYKRLTGEDMVVEPVHAGVECGAFAEKNPKLDMIAIGPTLMDVHTPNETCNLPSVEITMELLRNIIQAISDRE